MRKIFLGLGLLASSVLAVQMPCVESSSSECVESIGVSTSFTSEYYRTFSLGNQNADITRAVIVVHGVLRDADEYFSTIVNAARAVGELNHIVIIAPWFKSLDDKPSKGELYWKERRWKYGDPADNSGAEQVGAYDVMDRLIERLRKRDSFPNLKTIVVTGHSAGGQFVSRYLAGNSETTDANGVELKYVVANPSSYLYLNENRPVPGKPDQFEIPKAADCPDFDQYAYGLENRNPYMSRAGVDAIRTNVAHRHVTIFLGDADTGSEDLDQTCAANLEGPNRYTRGVAYFGFLRQFYPGAGQELVVIPGVAHDHRLMYDSPLGRKVLFD